MNINQKCLNLKINTLEQLKHANNYDFLREKIKKDLIHCFALWVDVITSDVYMFSYNEKRFIRIDEDSYEKLFNESKTSFE